mgnify:FL=1
MVEVDSDWQVDSGFLWHWVDGENGNVTFSNQRIHRFAQFKSCFYCFAWT